MKPLINIIKLLFFLAAGSLVSNAAQAEETLRVLFIGNSYTARHNLYHLVKTLAEAGDPRVKVKPTAVILGGRTLADHWRLGTCNYLNLASIRHEQIHATMDKLNEALRRDPEDKTTRSALASQRQLLKLIEQSREKWDVVVLQSYQDDTQGPESPYFDYAMRFSALIKAQGGRVVLYETTPATQNAFPLRSAPDPLPVLVKAHHLRNLAAKLDAAVVPMSSIALHCQSEHPDLTLRFEKDTHLNHTMAFLTACAFQGALFNRTAEGLRLDQITDTQSLDREHPDLDRDGNPRTRVFSPAEQQKLQRIAWAGYQSFITGSEATSTISR